jgi:hypothetical protein
MREAQSQVGVTVGPPPFAGVSEYEVVDDEVEAMRECVLALLSLDEVAQKRVIRYLTARVYNSSV